MDTSVGADRPKNSAISVRVHSSPKSRRRRGGRWVHNARTVGRPREWPNSRDQANWQVIWLWLLAFGKASQAVSHRPQQFRLSSIKHAGSPHATSRGLWCQAEPPHASSRGIGGSRPAPDPHPVGRTPSCYAPAPAPLRRAILEKANPEEITGAGCPVAAAERLCGCGT